MKEYRTIPKNPRYGIATDGEVKDLHKGKILSPTTNREKPAVVLEVGDKIIKAEIGRLVLNAWVPLKVPSEMMRVFRVEYLDQNPENYNLENLRWVGPAEPVPYKYLDGFFYIPEYTRYVMNRDNMVLDTATMSFVNNQSRGDSYIRVSLMKDGFDKTESKVLHRIKMLTFKPIFFEGKKMLVNHIDGNKQNLDLDNLEWTDYSGNNKHASETGLKTDNMPVKLRNILTGEEELIYSMAECARRFGKKTERVWDYLHNQPDKIRFDHYLIKWASDETPWPPFTKDDCFIPDNGRPVPMLLKNVNTGEIVEVGSSAEAEKVTGVKLATIRYYVRNKIPRAKNGWMFKDIHDKEPWLEETLKEGEFHRVNKREQTRFTIHDKETDELLLECYGFIKVAEYIGVDPRTIQYHRRRSDDGLCCKQYRIRKHLKGKR